MKFTKMKQLLLNMGPIWKKIPRPIMLNSIRNLPQIRHLHKASSIHLELSSEVRSALANNEPIVALESTIITHGMPFPRNYETAVKVENICRLKVRKPLTRLCKWFHAEWIRVHELFTSFELLASVQLQSPHVPSSLLIIFLSTGCRTSHHRHTERADSCRINQWPTWGIGCKESSLH